MANWNSLRYCSRASVYRVFLALAVAALIPLGAQAQIVAAFDSGSDGSDGVLSPTAPLSGTEDHVIDMGDHLDGIYQYASVNIPAGIIVRFIPNVNNTPITWLVQGDCVIEGVVALSGFVPSGQTPGLGGPGGFAGGYGGNMFGPNFDAGSGEGPGGGPAPNGNAAYGGGANTLFQAGGSSYGNRFLLPLIGGSGGAGGQGSVSAAGAGGAGGGGAILIAVTNSLSINGTLTANGNNGGDRVRDGSGGGIRLVSSSLAGNGQVRVWGGADSNAGGQGRIRVETYDNAWTGTFTGATTFDYPGVLVLPANLLPTLAITTVASLAVTDPPTGDVTTPDVTIPATQANPIVVEVALTNVTVGTILTLDVKPQFGAGFETLATNAGTLAVSTASFSVDLPSGDGLMEARAVVDISGVKSLAMSGLAPNGERFKTISMSSTLGGPQTVVFVTESGARFTLPQHVDL